MGKHGRVGTPVSLRYCRTWFSSARSGLPECALVCYKPCMRKWMRDRFKRRKPKAEEPSKTSDSSQRPLQPAYFDAQEPVVAPPAPSDEGEAAPPVESAVQS